MLGKPLFQCDQLLTFHFLRPIIFYPLSLFVVTDPENVELVREERFKFLWMTMALVDDYLCTIFHHLAPDEELPQQWETFQSSQQDVPILFEW
jgi:hypothetical protein